MLWLLLSFLWLLFCSCFFHNFLSGQEVCVGASTPDIACDVCWVEQQWHEAFHWWHTWQSGADGHRLLWGKFINLFAVRTQVKLLAQVLYVCYVWSIMSKPDVSTKHMIFYLIIMPPPTNWPEALCFCGYVHTHSRTSVPFCFCRYLKNRVVDWWFYIKRGMRVYPWGIKFCLDFRVTG